jgi:hypothetical protein
MTPYEQAKALYSTRPDMRLEWDMEMHAANGYVFAGPEFFALIRPVNKSWKPDSLANIRTTAPQEHADCWFVWLLCGSLKEAVKHLPYALPWVGFSQRGQPARFIELEKALAKLG